MTFHLDLHPDFLTFAKHLLDEHGPAITLGAIVDLIANRNADTLATAAGLKNADVVLEGVAALQVDFSKATLLTDLVDRDQKEKASTRIAPARVKASAGLGTWRPQITEKAHRQWDIVAGGLRLALYSLVVLLMIGLGLASAMVIAAMSSAAEPDRRTDNTVFGLIYGAMLLAGLVTICNLLGQARCCAAPAESGARSWAIASLLCYLLGPVIGCFWGLLVVSTTGESQRASALLFPTGVSLALVLLGHILFVIALGKIGRYFRDRATVLLAISCLVFDATLVAASLVGGFLQTPLPFGASGSVPQATRVSAAGPGAAQIPATAYGLAGLLLYLGLVNRTRDVLHRMVLGDV